MNSRSTGSKPRLLKRAAATALRALAAPALGASPIAALALAALPLATPPALAQEVDYHRAELLLGWHTSPLVAGGPVAPNWIHDSDRFWYRNNSGAGHEFTFVDPVGNVQRPLFDHYRLAAALSLAADTSYVPEKLPFDDFEFMDGDEGRIEFSSGAKRFECDIGAYMCEAGDTLPDATPFVESPDERWEAFVTDHNLFVRPAAAATPSS